MQHLGEREISFSFFFFKTLHDLALLFMSLVYADFNVLLASSPMKAELVLSSQTLRRLHLWLTFHSDVV